MIRLIYALVEKLRSRSSSEELFREDVFKLLRSISAKNYLDLGCNDGEWTLKIAQCLRAENIYGLEINQTFATECKNKGIITEIGSFDGCKFLFSDEIFDCVTCNQVIEHISDTDMFIDEIYRVLRPGGYLVISTPNLASWNHVLSLCFGYQPICVMISDRSYLGNPLFGSRGQVRLVPTKGHLRIFTLYSLSSFLKFNGFEIIKALGSGYLGLPKILARILSSIDRRHAINSVILARKKLKDERVREWENPDYTYAKRNRIARTS